MRIFVTAKTKARIERVEEVNKTHLTVSVKQEPIDGKANEAIVKLVAQHLGVSKSALTLRSGAKGKHKVFEIE